MARQLTFDLPVREALGREDFMVAPSNALALRSVEGWRDWPGGKLVLVGPEGAGKTHLAHVWAQEAGARIVSAGALGGADIAALCATPHIAVEDADAIAGRVEAETALFHLHNHLLERGGRLLLSAKHPPQRWPLVLPDLASRMQAASCATLEPPDDTLLAAVLVKLFADRQIAVPPRLVAYLVARMERSMAAARALVARLDAKALAQSRPLSRALAAEVLAEASMDSTGPGAA